MGIIEAGGRVQSRWIALEVSVVTVEDRRTSSEATKLSTWTMTSHPKHGRPLSAAAVQICFSFFFKVLSKIADAHARESENRTSATVRF